MIRWLKRQVTGTASNTREVGGAAKDSVPSPMMETWDSVKSQVPKALGKGTPAQQIAASGVISVVVIASSLVSAGATLVLLVPLGFLMVIGIARLIPAVDDTWSRDSTGDTQWSLRKR